jgi:hypothetical protein
MLRKSFLLLLLGFNFGCIGPKVTIGISDPKENGLLCHDQRTDKDFFKPYQETENWVCLPPTDMARLLDYCKH